MLLAETGRTLRLAWPIILGQLSQIALGVIDSVMVGPLGAANLAAVSVSIGVFSVPLVFGLGISFAISPLTAIAKGRQDTQQIGDIFRSGFWTLFGMGIALVLLMIFVSQGVHLLKQEADVTSLAIPYLRILGYSMLPILVFQHFKQFSEGLEIMWPPLLIGLLMIPVNTFGNWLLIYGNWGFPAMGLEGAGWATTISRVLAAVAMMGFIFFNRRFAAIEPFKLSWRRVHKATVKRILKLGVPGGFQYIFETSAFAFSAILIGWLGANALAAHQIAINLASISFMVAIGLSSASAIRIGHASGKKDFVLAKRIGKSSILLSAAFMAVCGLVFVLGRFYFPSLYIQDPLVIQITAQLLIIAAIFQIADGIQAVGVGLCRGLEDVKKPTLFVLIAYWFIALPVGAFFAFKLEWGVVGLWIGLAGGLFISAVLLTYRFFKQIDRHIASAQK